MFNLDNAIHEWRRQMAADGIKAPELLDELESHLREEIARQTRAGTDPSIALKAAIERIGRARDLNSEFTKAAARKHWWQANLFASPELERKVAGALLVAMGWLISVGMSVPILFKLGSCSGMNPAQQTAALVATLLIGVMIACGKNLHPLLPAVADKRARTTAILAGLLFVMAEFSILFYGVLPRVTLTESQLLVVLLWAMVPWATFIGLVLGFEEAARRKSAARS